jgi:hypothetical protein
LGTPLPRLPNSKSPFTAFGVGVGIDVGMGMGVNVIEVSALLFGSESREDVTVRITSEETESLDAEDEIDKLGIPELDIVSISEAVSVTEGAKSKASYL